MTLALFSRISLRCIRAGCFVADVGDRHSRHTQAWSTAIRCANTRSRDKMRCSKIKSIPRGLAAGTLAMGFRKGRGAAPPFGNAAWSAYPVVAKSILTSRRPLYQLYPRWLLGR